MALTWNIAFGWWLHIDDDAPLLGHRQGHYKILGFLCFEIWNTFLRNELYFFDWSKSLSEALIFATTNPQDDDRLFIELQVQYMKIPSSNLGRTCCVQKLFLIFRTIFVHNMFSPYFAKRRASDKDLLVIGWFSWDFFSKFFEVVHYFELWKKFAFILSLLF